MNRRAFMPISALMVALLLALVAAMTPFVVEREVAHAQTGSAVTTLTKLTVAAGGAVASETVPALGLMPKFVSDAAPASDGYVVYVANNVTQVTVDAEETHSQAEVTYSNDANTDTNATVTLATDDDLETKIDVKVTAQNDVDTATYTINVMRASSAADTLDTLASLSVMAGGNDLTLAPAFATTHEAASGSDPGHSEMPYEANVSAATSSVVVSAAATHTGATVKTSSGTQMGDGMNDSFTLKAAGMATTIMVKVTAQDKATSTTYHIKVNRAASTASKDTKLSVLKLTTVTLTATDVDDSTVTEAAALTLSPTFTANGAPASSGYSASVAADVGTISVVAASSSRGAAIAVMAEGTGASAATDLNTTDPDEAISVVTLATSGATTVKVEVTAADKATKATYPITVTKEVANSNNMLSSLDLGIDSMPPFSTGTMSYRAVAPSSMASLDVMATSAHPKADVIIRKVVGEPDNETDEDDDMKIGEGIGSVSAMVPIGVGLNTITVEVDPVLQGTLSEYYKVVVRREMSDDATLSALSLGDDVSMSPAFAGTRTRYTAKVPPGTAQVTVMATASHDNAKRDIKPDDTDTEMEGHQVAISGDGTASITVEVTAEDGETKRIYMVGVSTISTVSTLSTLSLMDSDGMAIDLMDSNGMSVAFMSDIDMYYADVANDVDMVTVMATETHSEATASGDVGAVSLDVGENTITVTVTAEDGTTTTIYTVMVDRAASADASLSSLSLTDDMGMDVTLVAGVAAHWNTLDCSAMNDRVGADDEPDDATSPYCKMYDGLNDAAKAVVDATYEEDPIEGFMSDIDMYYASVANDVDMVTVMATETHSEATASGDVGAVSLDVGDNTITVTVTAEDGTTMMPYTVMVDRASSNTLLERYDTNGNMEIDKEEVLKAIDDYLFHEDRLTKDEVLELINMYLFGAN